MKTTLALAVPNLVFVLFAVLFLNACSSPDHRSPYPTSAQSRAEYDSASLQLLNAEQMNAIVVKKIKRAEEIQKKQDVDDDRGIVAEPEAIDQLRDATRIVFARPDQDGSRERTFARLRRELTDLNALEDVLKSIATEGIEALKHPDRHSPREQGTYIVVLENLMAEVKPEISSNPTFKKIVETIRDAKIELTDEVRNQQLLRSMNRPVSPSETAAKNLPKK